MECEYRANLTQEEYEGLQPGEFRFDYESWARRLVISKKQLERAIKELTTKNIVIIQTEKGKRGTCSKYFLARFREKKKEKKEENNRSVLGEELSVDNTMFVDILGEEKESDKERFEEKKKEQSSQYNNLNIKSINIYSAKKEQKVLTENDVEEVWKAYPNKKGKQAAIKSITKILKNISKDELLRTIERYRKDVEYQRGNGFSSLQYKNGSTFFNGGYVDYLDNNYQEQQEKPQNKEHKLNFI